MTLLRVLAALRPQLAHRSSSSLCNLLWALGRMAGVASGSVKAARARQAREDWIRSPAGVELQATASSVLIQLMQPSRRLKPHELAAVAVAVAAHADHAAGFPAAPMAALRGACGAAAAARELSTPDLAHVAGAAARLHWRDRATVDALAADMQARCSTWSSEVGLAGNGAASHMQCAAWIRQLGGGLRAPWLLGVQAWSRYVGLAACEPRRPRRACPAAPAGVHAVHLGTCHAGARPPRAPV